MLGSLLLSVRRRVLTTLSLGLVAGVVAQIIIGAIVVLTGLNPWANMAHFLVSIAIVAGAHALWVRISGTPEIRVREQMLLDVGSRLLVALATLVIVLGTIVTGSGPHSGDAERPARLGFDPQLMSWIHADAVWLTGGLVLSLWAYARWSLRNPILERRTRRVLEIVFVQGAVGYAQYWTGLPWYLVAVHAALAAWFWVAALHVRSAARAAASA